MYALHPGSLPPKGARAKERTSVSASDLMALYGIAAEDCIVWDAADRYDWFDFIHLYPSYYERYTLRPDGTPDKDVPCATSSSTAGTGSSYASTRAGTTTSVKRPKTATR